VYEEPEKMPSPCPLAVTAMAARGERRDAAANRARVLAAARALFAAHGPDATSMNEVARAAGVGAGTLYRRYAHKGELCAALLGENTAAFRGETAAHLAAPGIAPLDSVAFVLRRIVAFNEANGALLGAMAGAANGARRVVVFDGSFYGWLHDRVRDLLTRAIAAGDCAPLDPVWTADALLAPLAIDLYLYQRHGRGFTPEQIAAAATALLDRLRER